MSSEHEFSRAETSIYKRQYVCTCGWQGSVWRSDEGGEAFREWREHAHPELRRPWATK